MHEIVHDLFRRVLAWQLPVRHKQAWKVIATTVYCTCTSMGGKSSCPGPLDDSFFGPCKRSFLTFANSQSECHYFCANLLDYPWVLPLLYCTNLSVSCRGNQISWIKMNLELFFALAWISAQANEKSIFTVCNNIHLSFCISYNGGRGGCILSTCNRDKIQGFLFCLQEL